jgi:hypothetical protein
MNSIGPLLVLLLGALCVAITPTGAVPSPPWAAKYLVFEKAAYQHAQLQNLSQVEPMQWYANRGISLHDIIYDETAGLPDYFYHLDKGGDLRPLMLQGRVKDEVTTPLETVVAWAWTRAEVLITAIQYSQAVYKRTMGPDGAVNVTTYMIPKQYVWHAMGEACVIQTADGEDHILGIVAKRTTLHAARWRLRDGKFALLHELPATVLGLFCSTDAIVQVDQARNAKLGMEARAIADLRERRLESKTWTGTFQAICACNGTIVMLDPRFKRAQYYTRASMAANECRESNAPPELFHGATCACNGDSVQWVSDSGHMFNMTYAVSEDGSAVLNFAKEPFEPERISNAIAVARYGALFDPTATPADAPTDTTENTAGTAIATAVLLLAIIALVAFLFWLHYRATPYHWNKPHWAGNYG